MNQADRNMIKDMLSELKNDRTKLNELQDREESESLDQALDDLEMVIEDLHEALADR